MSTIAFTLKDDIDTDYVGLLKQLVEKDRKPGERPNLSEYVRKLILEKAKKAGLL